MNHAILLLLLLPPLSGAGNAPTPAPSSEDTVRFSIALNLVCDARPTDSLRALFLEEVADAIELPLSALQGLTTSAVAVPTAAPTAAPTPLPTLSPSLLPTPLPTALPTPRPTGHPSPLPTSKPTLAPTLVPTYAPTPAPTVICGDCDQTLELFMQTNYFGSEISWSLREAEGSSSDGTYATNCSRNISMTSLQVGVAYSGQYIPYNPTIVLAERQYLTKISQHICANQKYDFTIRDEAGNGFQDCCPGADVSFMRFLFFHPLPLHSVPSIHLSL